MVLTAIGIRAQVLATVLEPTHRRSRAHREPGQRHLFATEQALVAEAAAHVGRNYANRTVVEAEALGHAALHDVRHLGRADEREKTQPGVPMGEDAASLQREHAMARGADFARDLDGGD